MKNCRWCDPRAAAVALVRWGLGLMFLMFGIGKLANYSGFVAHMTKQFEKSWLQPALVSLFSHVLPFAETTLGALLLLGLFRNVALFLTGLLLLVLGLGQLVLGESQVVASIITYLFIVAAVLFAARFDQWVLFPRPGTEPCPEDKSAGPKAGA